MRIRQHVNPLRADFLEIALEPLVLPAGPPVEVELGSADAQFLQERAVEEPRRFYVGVEIRRELVEQANRRCRRMGLSQVHSVFANIAVDLLRLFRPARVARFFVNFPDPWFKQRQRKRRVVNEDLIGQMALLLEAGGEIHVATDIFDIALDAMAALERAEGFGNMREPWSFLRRSPFAARSRRERRCEDLGIKIWRLAYRRQQA
ncbi:MAG: tRNA (guanosine(46)-N7)-methyltransferase TrmB [Deltaproteobacteria bacterium]|jgi:tRNA (guanine-N7-)-methyltransferase|nr:tRNA (guanosine(46)-N7)-methyltransferase TrmB [Deltaproteobacteria bacterium]